MGPSGSGKSTLLNLLGCLDRPTSGQYFLGEEDVSYMDDDQLSEVRSRYIGFIFQSYNLLAQYTVAASNFGVTALDLAGDQRTLFYEAASGSIRRYDVEPAQQDHRQLRRWLRGRYRCGGKPGK